MKPRSKERTQRTRKTSGKPGGGKGRREVVRGAPIYPASGPLPPGPAEVTPAGALGHPEHAATTPRGLAVMVPPGKPGARSQAQTRTLPRQAAALRKAGEALAETPHDIARADWEEFLDGFSVDHTGWHAHIRVFQPDQTSRMESHGLPFEGVSLAQTGEDTIVAVSAGTEGAAHLTHMVPRATRITAVNAHELEIESADLDLTVVRCEEAPG